ncbi:MAG: hypothetical protein M3Y88_07555, partial [Chloroflexota bacterium]|nr:hypothetical protein [Chloroflexota bacterium]
MPVLSRKRALAMLAAGSFLVLALIAVTGIRAGMGCSITWMANDFGLDRSSSAALTPTEVQALTTKVHKQFPSATIEEAERATLM